MKVKLKPITLISIIWSSVCFGSGSTAYGTITEMYTNNNWTMVIVPGIRDHATVNGNPDECASKSYYAIMPEDKNYQSLHAVLMAAQMASKEVRFYVSGCAGQNGQYPHIVSIWSK